MAARKSDKSDNSSNFILERESGETGNDGNSGTGNGSGSGGNSGTIDGKPVASLDGAAGDEYARDDAGNIVRNKDGSPRKKRGRKPGGRNSGSSGQRKGNSQTLNDSVQTLSQSLAILHLGIASFMKFEEMELSKNEADTLASATVNVLDQFDLRPDPRITAIVGLVTTAGTIYGPRYYIYKARKKTEKPKDAKPEDSNIEPFIGPITHGMLNG